MKVAYIIQSLHEAGTSVQAIATCEALRATGLDIELVILRRSGVFTDRAENNKIPLHYLPNGVSFSAVGASVYLANYIRQRQPDIIISGAKRINLISLLGWVLAAKKPQLILTLTNNLLQKTSEKSRGRWISTKFQIWAYKFADHIIVLSKAMKSDLIAYGFSKEAISYIPPIINMEYIREQTQEPLDHNWLSFPKTERKIPVVLAVGRLSAQKNYPLLLKAFAKAKQSLDMKLVVLGTGKAKQNYKILKLIRALKIEDSVDVYGFAKNPYKFMHSANVFVLSSQWEGFGIVMVEALACGLPVVAVDCPHGPRDIIGENEYGYLIPMNDIEALANGLLKAIKHPHSQKVLTERARSFGAEQSTQSYLKLIQTVHDTL